MCIYSVSVIKGRVAVATEESRIAIFETVLDGKVVFDAAFENTVCTCERLRSHRRDCIGIFHGEIGAEHAEDRMLKILERAKPRRTFARA